MSYLIQEKDKDSGLLKVVKGMYVSEGSRSREKEGSLMFTRPIPEEQMLR